MAGLDTKYIPLNYLQEYFVKVVGDSGIGLPLAGGLVNFYSDNHRITPKTVYKITGTAPNYTYTPLGSSLTLSASGTFVDEDGNDITVFAYPYTIVGEVENYFIQVYSADSEPQFSREAVPNIASSSQTVSNFYNYIPNGQLNIYNSTIDVGVPIKFTGSLWAYGASLESGSFFWYKNNNSATDVITLKRVPDGLGLEGNPSFYYDVVCTNAGALENIKYLLIASSNCQQFEDEKITFSFVAKSDNNSTISISFGQNFGTGGSTGVETFVVSKVLTSSFQKYSVTFTPPSIAGKTIGHQDYWFIRIDFPFNQTMNVGITNFQLNSGEIIFPYQQDDTGSERIRKTSADLSTVGYGTINGRSNINLLNLMQSPILTLDGTNGLGGTATSGNLYYTLVDPYPIGSYVDVAHANDTYMLARGFWPCNGDALCKAAFPVYYSVIGTAYGNGDNTTCTQTGINALIDNYRNGLVADAVDVDTGFTITVTRPGSPSQTQLTQVSCIAASAMKNGSYFIHTTSPRSIKYGIIFFKNGIMAFPALPGPLHQWAPVFINETDTAAQVALALATAMNGFTCQVPDTRGMFLRSALRDAPAPPRDPDAATRSARPDGVAGNNVGTVQGWQNAGHAHSHAHTYGDSANWGSGSANAFDARNQGSYSTSTDATTSGGSQSNPVNIYACTYIKVR